MNIKVIAVLAVSLLPLAAAFQIGLAAGAQWGAAAYGGRAVSDAGALPEMYPPRQRRRSADTPGCHLGRARAGSIVGRGTVSP